jgi:hypothetical protein
MTRLGRIAGAFLLALAAIVSPSWADEGATRVARFYPMFETGQLVGCQIGFSVDRIDDEYAGGTPSMVNGLLVIRFDWRSGSPMPFMFVRLAVTYGGDFFAPERAYLRSGFRTNVSEARTSFPSEAGTMFVFDFGEQTVEAFTQGMISGRFRLAYGMPDTQVDAMLAVDLSDHPHVLQDFRDCFDALLETAA